MNEKKHRNDNIKIGSVWKKEGENSDYMIGRVSCPIPLILTQGNTILLFPNKSEHEKSPDYDVMITKDVEAIEEQPF